MNSRWMRWGLVPLGLGLALGIAGSIGFAAGWLTNDSVATNSSTIDEAFARELLLKADSAASTKNMAMVTGRIDQEVEGLFVLDYTSGNLFCWVLNPRGGGFLAQYVTNVRNEFGPLEQGRNPDYVMVTGFVEVVGGVGAEGRPAQCVVYVGDANTGGVVGYSLVWSRTRAATGGLQGGGLVKVAQGVARDATLIRQ